MGYAAITNGKNTIQNAFVKSLTQNMGAEKVRAILKRKVGYMEEQVSTMCTKLSEMDLNKDIEEHNSQLAAAE